MPGRRDFGAKSYPRMSRSECQNTEKAFYMITAIASIMVKSMKNILAFLLMAVVMLLVSSVPVCAEDDEDNEAKENEAGSGESDDDEKEKDMPGFEIAFAVAGIFAAARLLKIRSL